MSRSLRQLVSGGFPSLTSRLVITSVVLVAVVAALIGTAATLALHAYLAKRLDEDVVATAGRLHTRPGPPRLPGDDDGDPTADVSQTGFLTAVVGGEATPGGQVLTREHWQPLRADALTSLSNVPADGHPRDANVAGLGEYRLVAVDAAPYGRIVSGLPTTVVDGPVTRLVLWELLVGSLGTVAAAGASTYLVRRQLRPLRQVASTAHAVAALPLASGEIELAERVPERLTDERTEVGRVGAALNTLLAHVESSLERRHRSEQQVRQFVADASHELRTPLTTIAGYAELARRRPDDVGTLRKAVDKVEEESARMTSLVEDLLLLARLDAGRPLAREEVDLSRVLVDAVSDARIVTPDHRWQLHLPGESIQVTGDADRLHQVVTNLLTNAGKHTPAGTTVMVTGGSSGFTVHDDGPGFPPGLAGAAFERFVRGDISRTRSRDSGRGRDGAPAGGAGLGLSLVAAIVSAHGGTVTLDSHPGSTTVAVSLPR